jgi:AraC family transcriptional regulator
MRIPLYRYRVDYLTRYSDFNPMLLFAQKYEFIQIEHSPLRRCYANAIIFVEEGSGTLILNGVEHAMQAGSIVFIAAGVPHQWISSKEELMIHRCAYFDWTYTSRPDFNYQKDYFTSIEQPFREEWASFLPNLKLHTVMEVSNISIWLSHYNAFTQPPAILGARSPIESLQYNAAFQTFLFQYLSFAAKNDSWYEPRIAQILEKIEYIPFEQVEIDLYQWAKELKMGKSRFHQLFKNETGYTPKEYVQRRRLYQSAEDLCTTNLTVTEIAHKYNFSSIHYFSRLFRNVMGLSPSQYKAKYQ